MHSFDIWFRVITPKDDLTSCLLRLGCDISHGVRICSFLHCGLFPGSSVIEAAENVLAQGDVVVSLAI